MATSRMDDRALGVGPDGQGGGYVLPFSWGKNVANPTSAPKRPAHFTKPGPVQHVKVPKRK